MNAPPFPIAPDVGQMFQNWVWNGARWVATPTTGLRVLTQTFTASGPYMPSPGLVSCVVECIGGGGGGGGISAVSAQYIASGGGGGSGGYSRKTLPAALVRGGVLVTVGNGGAAGVGTTTPPDQQGGNGGTTTFGALCAANGGQGGSSFVPLQFSGYAGQPGGGASAGMGDVAFPGATGQQGATMIVPTQADIVAIGGLGGQTFGGNSMTEAWVGALNYGNPAGSGTGAGGSGGVVNQMAAGTAADGGAGGSGVCIVTEYCWGDRDQSTAEWRPPLDVNVSFPKPPWPGGQPGPVPPWPPGSPWWPWWPWPPGQAPHPPLPQPREFEAEQQSFQPWDDPNASDA